MDNTELLKCVYQLCDKWKTHFGLHTYYVGYLTPDLLISFLTVWRFSKPEEFQNLSENEIGALIEEKIDELRVDNNLKLSNFPHSEEIDTVLPKLIEVISNYDFSENNLPQEQWDEFVNYLISKSQND